MQDYIARDEDENVVGKWRTQTEPEIPDDVTFEKVDSVKNYEIEEIVPFFP